jgi:hypothetical protein
VAQWLGTTSDFAAFGQTPPSSGAIRLANNLSIVGRTTTSSDVQLLTLTNGDSFVLGNVSTQTIINGPAGASSVRFLANAAEVFRVGTQLTYFVDTLQWNAGQLSAVINQAATSVATGAPMSITAQGTTFAGGTGGNLTLTAGSSSGASGTRNGGILTLRSGTGTTAPGDVLMGWGATTIFGANNLATFVDHTNMVILRKGGATTFTADDAAFTSYARDYAWIGTVVTPRLLQIATSIANGAAMSIIAQDTTFAGGTGGSLTLTAGGSSGVSGTRTGGAFVAGSGIGSTTDGDVSFKRGATTVISHTTSGLVLGSTGFNTFVDTGSSGNINLRTNGVIRQQVTSSYSAWVVPSMRFDEAVASPTFYQNDDTTNSGTGQTFVVHSQDMKAPNVNTVGGALTIRAGAASGTGTGNRTGGALSLVGGSGTVGSGTLTGGDATFGSGTGSSADGNTFIQRGALIGVQITKPSSGLVIGLARTSTVTSGAMPANTGDKVLYIGQATTAPTTGLPVGGTILWVQNTTHGDGWLTKNEQGGVWSHAPQKNWHHYFRTDTQSTATASNSIIATIDVGSFGTGGGDVLMKIVSRDGTISSQQLVLGFGFSNAGTNVSTTPTPTVLWGSNGLVSNVTLTNSGANVIVHADPADANPYTHEVMFDITYHPRAA